jgi:hypothetical protein
MNLTSKTNGVGTHNEPVVTDGDRYPNLLPIDNNLIDWTRLVRPEAQFHQLAGGSVVKWGWWR